MDDSSAPKRETSPHHESRSVDISPERAPQQYTKAKEACLACRQTKVKCRPIDKDHAPPDTCSRCTRLKYECVYNQQKRGRKVGSKRKISVTNTDEKGPASGSKSSKRVAAHIRNSSSPPSSPPPTSSIAQLANESGPNSPPDLSSSASLNNSSQNLRAYALQMADSRFTASHSPSLPPSTNSSSYNSASVLLYPHAQPHSHQLSSSFLPPANLPMPGSENYAEASSSGPQSLQMNPSGLGSNMAMERSPSDGRGAYNQPQNMSGYPQPQSQVNMPSYSRSEQHQHMQQHQSSSIAPSYGQTLQPTSYPTDQSNYNQGPSSWFKDTISKNPHQTAYRMGGPSPSVPFDGGAGGDSWAMSGGVEPSYIRTQIPYQPSSQPAFPSTDRYNGDNDDDTNAHNNGNSYQAEAAISAPLPGSAMPDRPANGLNNESLSRSSSIASYSLPSHSRANTDSRTRFTPVLGDSSSSSGLRTTPKTMRTGTAGSPASSSSSTNRSGIRRAEARGVLSLAEMLIEKTDDVPEQGSEEEEHPQKQSQSQSQHQQQQLQLQLKQQQQQQLSQQQQQQQQQQKQQQLSQQHSQRRTEEENPTSGGGDGGGTGTSADVDADTEEAGGIKKREKPQLEPTKKTIGWEDPIGVGLVSVEQAVMMFETYHNYMNVFIDLLDPVLHTPSFTRETSPVLFSAVLTASAKFVLPAIYPKLLDFTNNMIGRCFGVGVLEIGLIQALSILSFWKPATDNSSFRRVGYAIRLAYELNLHEPHVRPLPDDEHEIRMIFDRERTWYQMACFDLTSHMQHDLPPMIDEDLSSMERWLFDEPRFHSPFDSMTVGSYLLLRNFVGLHHLKKQKYDVEVTSIMLGHLREKTAVLKEKMGDDNKYPMHPACRTVLMFYFAVFSLELDQMSISREFSPMRITMASEESANKALASCSMEDIASFTRCIKSTLECLRRITEEMKPLIEFSQDTIVLIAVGAVTWLAKNYSILPDNYRNEVIGVLYNVQNVFQQVSKDSNDAYAYQAAFFQSVLLHCFVSAKRGSVSRTDSVGHGISLSFTSTPQNGASMPPAELQQQQRQQQQQQQQPPQLFSEQQTSQLMQNDAMPTSNGNAPIFTPDNSLGASWSIMLENPQMFDVQNNMSMDDLLGHFSDLAPARHDVWPP